MRVRELAQEQGIEIQVETRCLETEEAAVEARLLGSPTLQIQGRDIDPMMRELTAFGST